MTTLTLSDLRERARAVDTGTGSISARSAARVLSGIVALLAQRYGRARVQGAAASLAADEGAWTSRLTQLPRLHGSVDDVVSELATATRGLLGVWPADSLQAALAFWGTERDPVAWERVAAGVAA
jgi:hypothetical protein